MDRRAAAIIAACVVAAATVAAAKPKKKATTSKAAVELHLRAIDLAHRLVLVEIGGVQKPPSANFFTFTDDRGRHYIAQSIHCDPPLPAGTRACELEIPVGYERHPLTGVELHLRGLHGRAVAATADEIKAAWATAEQAHAPPTFVSPPDGGVAPASPAGGTDLAH
jgi:hypothetical protein